MFTVLLVLLLSAHLGAGGLTVNNLLSARKSVENLLQEIACESLETTALGQCESMGQDGSAIDRCVCAIVAGCSFLDHRTV